MCTALAVAATTAGAAEAAHAAPAPAAADSAPAAAEARVRQLERIVRARVDSGRSTGIVAGVLLPNGRTRVIAYGDAGAGRRLDTKSAFEIGSITKVFTASLLSDMVARGEVRLDDPVERFLPEGVRMPARGNQRIRLVDLATHMSGLPRVPTNLRPTDAGNPYADYTVAQLYEFLSGYEPPRAIGARHEYSNLGVGLLGHALARRAGKPYEALVRERVLAPLGMTTTGITGPPAMLRRFAAVHDGRGEAVSPWDLPTLAGAGALRSTIGDMLRFAAANLGRRDGRLGRAIAATHTPRHRIDAGLRVGLGWQILRHGGREMLLHDGGTGGSSSFIGLDKTRRTAIVVLSNSEPGIQDIGLHFLNRRLPLAPPDPRRDIALAPEVLDRYVGVYRLAEDVLLTVTRTAKGLHAEVTGQGRWPIYAATETEFFWKVAPASLTFQRDAGGAVTGVIVHQNGGDTAATKIADGARPSEPGRAARGARHRPDAGPGARGQRRVLARGRGAAGQPGVAAPHAGW
jgi:D-alanyl-D-alanine-carboxypeptidase/D-alanyl-D-alanine-endopeptidase